MLGQEINEHHLQLFFETMFERQEIWHRRFILKQDKPWTENEILRDYKFTNVYRELDRNSQFQIDNFFKGETNRKELIWKTMFFRFFNNPEFFTFIKKQTDDGHYSFRGYIPDWADFKMQELRKLVELYREENLNPFTNAYLVNSQACPGMTRDNCFITKVIPTLHGRVGELSLLLKKARNPEEIIKYLETLPSVAGFMSHEFYQDFTYSERYTDIKLMRFDQNDFTNAGPGAVEGLKLIFPNLKTRKQYTEAIYYLRDISSKMLERIGSFKYLGYNKKFKKYFVSEKGFLTLHNIEMWLCEQQKYVKMQRGTGKQRSKYIQKTF